MTSSFLDELRAMDKHLRAHTTKTLLVPGSGGRLAVRYRPPANPESLGPATMSFNTGIPLGPDDEKQLLVDCCDEILRADPDTDTEAPFDDQGPLRFDASDERWGEANTAKECVGRLFRSDQQPLAIGRHVASIVQWLQGVDAEIAARVEGKRESGATANS